MSKHPLDGKYIVYKYTEQDYSGEGSALALFKLEGDKLVEVYHPMMMKRIL